MIKKLSLGLLPFAAALVALFGAFGGAQAQILNAAFTTPVELPNSANGGEPSLIIDSTGRLYATFPQGLGNVTGSGSPVWTSTDRGATWSQPTNPSEDPVAGGDTDLALDSKGDLYQVDLWLGNSAVSLSTDHGQTWTSNEWGHLTPVDDRPWLAYDKSSDTMYMAWDGADAIHVARTASAVALSQNPQAGLLFPQDVPAVPECLLGGNNPCDTSPIRQCVCPPGGIAVDQSSGQVYVSYSRQNGGTLGGGTGVSTSTDGGLTWTHSSVPNSGGSGSAFDTQFNFSPIAVDSHGVVYVAWGEGVGTPDANRNYPGGVVIKYSYSADHGQTWSAPVKVSTTTTSVFPSLDVVSPGVVDIAYYGTSSGITHNADPNIATGPWNVYLTKVTGANTATPTLAGATAVLGIHSGCIQSGGAANCSDRSLLDFFQLRVDSAGLANIIYAQGDATAGTNLFFVREQPPAPSPSPSPSPSGIQPRPKPNASPKGPPARQAPSRAVATVDQRKGSAPWGGALLIGGAAAAAIVARRRRKAPKP